MTEARAIGDRIRAYARTDPDWVRDFVEARRDRLSTLSIREATKHLDGTPHPSSPGRSMPSRTRSSPSSARQEHQ